MSKRLFVGLAAIVAFLASGIVLALPMAGAASTAAVSMPSGASTTPPGYSPHNATVVIGVNNTVVWTNNDNAIHTVYWRSHPAGATVTNSTFINAGGTFQQTFTVPGTYEYYCNVHPTVMTGSVIVLAGTNTVPEFPVASLALILFAVIAAVILAAPRLRPLLGRPVAASA